MSKFLEIEVTKKVGTTIYVEVPDNFDIEKDSSKINLKLAVAETVSDEDWDDENEPLTAESIKETNALVADMYGVHVH